MFSRHAKSDVQYPGFVNVFSLRKHFLHWSFLHGRFVNASPATVIAHRAENASKFQVLGMNTCDSGSCSTSLCRTLRREVKML